MATDREHAISLTARYRRSGDLATRAVAEETILVPIRGEIAQLQRIFALNPVAAFIWDQLVEERSLEALLAAILDAFDAKPEEARSDLLELVAALEAAGLIEAAQD